jgi:hypothetical protein
VMVIIRIRKAGERVRKNYGFIRIRITIEIDQVVVLDRQL